MTSCGSIWSILPKVSGSVAILFVHQVTKMTCDFISVDPGHDGTAHKSPIGQQKACKV